MAPPSGKSQHVCKFPLFWARRERAAEREIERSKRSDERQLKLLNGRSGNSARERAKLEARIAKASA